MALWAYLVIVPTAFADEARSAVRLQLVFSAPPGCAVVEDFERQVRTRSDRIVFVEQPPREATARLELTRTRTAVQVSLSWTRDHGEPTTRQFSAPSCAEAIDAAALVTAITFDPSAPTVASPAETPGEASQSTESDAPSAGRPNETGQEPEPPAADDETSGMQIPVTDAGALNQRRPRRPRPAPSTPTRVQVSGTLLFEGLSGVAPASLEGLGLGASVGFGDDFFAPQLRAARLHYLELTYPAAGGEARFELDAIRVLACPVRVGRTGYGFRPCATGLGARLTASGHDTDNPQSHERPLWLFGGTLLAEFRPLSVLLMTAQVALSFPLARDRFQFAPEQFHQVSKLVSSGGVGVGVQFP